MKENRFTLALVSYGSLFTSFGTLICCAIPSTLVLLGFGASLSSFLGVFPQLIWLSEHKGLVFGMSFGMLALSFLAQQYAKNLPCPIEKKADCEATRRASKLVFLFSLVINVIGATFAFIL